MYTYVSLCLFQFVSSLASWVYVLFILWNLLVFVLQGVQRFYEDKIAQPCP